MYALIENRIFKVLLVICFLTKVFFANAQNAITLSIIPKPIKVVNLQGEYVYTSKSNITNYNKTTSLLKAELQVLGNEGYILIIKADGIAIHANTRAGEFYALQTLHQLLPISNTDTAILPCLKITDSPRFAWRGLHLDESRHFFGKAFVKKTLDLLAMLKMNVFHWHLTDDQGWRIEIKKYPKLTEIGAWRDDKRAEPWNYFQYATTLGKPSYGGFYTQDDIKEIVKYAADRNITIVPEIDLPGHSAAAIYAYNWLSCSSQPWTIKPNSPFEFADPLCICDDKVVEFTKDILSEVIALFPSQYIHIGGDECKLQAWESVPMCKQIMEKEKLKTTVELQGRFNKQLEKFII